MDTLKEGHLSERFVEETHDIDEPDVSDQQGKALVPFASALELTLAQEQALMEHLFRRKEELEIELGRNNCKGNDWFSGDALDATMKDKARRSFFGKRELFELTYKNDVTWREYLLGPPEDNIFCTSNLTAPISRRIARQMVARANNYFFGTDPWLAAYPVGPSDGDLADKADKFGKYKLDKCGAKAVFELANEMAFVRGEAVLKTTSENRENIYALRASVLVDNDGKPVIALDGDYILADDLWVEGTKIEIDPLTREKSEPLPTGQMVLKRDGETPQPPAMVFKELLVKRRMTLYKGPRVDLVYFKDFLCPLTAASVQEADCIIHLYDMPVSDLVDTYMRQNLEDGDNVHRPSIERLVSIIREMNSESSAPKSSKNQTVNSEENYRGSEGGVGPVADIAEFYLRFDADQDGILEEIFVVADVRSKRPLFYDYTANMTPDGQRPFDVVTINKVDGQWWGIGAMEMFETHQEVIDLLLNRWNVSQTEAGRVTTFNPSACYEGDTDPDLRLNRGRTYTLKTGKKIEDLVQSEVLVDVKFDAIKEQLDFFLQMAMNESGVQHANDAQMVGLDQAKLATGIRNIEKSGQEIFAPFLSHAEPAFQSCLKRFLKLLFARMDDAETFEFFEGKVGQILSISASEIGDLDMNVDLEMTRYHGEQQLQSNLQAATHVQTFYTFPPLIQERVAPFYIQILKALQIQDADLIIQPLPQPASVDANGMPVPAAAPALGAPQGPQPSTIASPANI